MANEPEIPVNLYNFEELTRLTIENSVKLMQYFKLNLIYYQLVSGKGLEFDRIRKYVVGDNVTRIDWKVLARTKKVFVKTYKEERQFDIIIVLDVSDSMLLGTTDILKNQFGALVAGVLSYAAIDSRDKVAIVMHSKEKIIATNPVNNFNDILKVLSEKENYGGKKDWRKLINTLISNYREDSILFIISDFIDTKPNEFLPALSSHFSKVYGIMVHDPIDEKIPAGVGSMYLTDTDVTKSYLTNLDAVRADYEVLSIKNVENVKNQFTSNGQLFFKVLTNEDFATAFIKGVGKEKVILY